MVQIKSNHRVGLLKSIIKLQRKHHNWHKSIINMIKRVVKIVEGEMTSFLAEVL